MYDAKNKKNALNNIHLADCYLLQTRNLSKWILLRKQLTTSVTILKRFIIIYSI